MSAVGGRGASERRNGAPYRRGESDVNNATQRPPEVRTERNGIARPGTFTFNYFLYSFLPTSAPTLGRARPGERRTRPRTWDAPARETRERPPANARPRICARTPAIRLLYLCIFCFLPRWAMGIKPPGGGGWGDVTRPETVASVRPAGGILKRLKKRYETLPGFPGRRARRGTPGNAPRSARRGFRKVCEKNIKPRLFCMNGATATTLRHPRHVENASGKPGDYTQNQTKTPGYLRKNIKQIPPGARVSAGNAPKICRKTGAS